MPSVRLIKHEAVPDCGAYGVASMVCDPGSFTGTMLPADACGPNR
jgi:hypothetical protein